MAEAEPDEFLETGKVPGLIKAIPELKTLLSTLKCHICYQLMVSHKEFHFQSFLENYIEIVNRNAIKYNRVYFLCVQPTIFLQSRGS